MPIFLSPLAEKRIELLLVYLEKEWGPKVKNEFLILLFQNLKQVEKYSKSKIQSKSQIHLFKSALTKNTSYFYRINSEDIEVITLIDNPQNPSNIEKELKSFFS